MKLIGVNDVIVPPNRQRREIDELSLGKLAESFKKGFGLMQPIVLRNDQKTLVAGERRLRAAKLLYDKGDTFTHDSQPVRGGCIPFVCLSDLPADAIHEAELEENVQRKDLTWQERYKAIAELHELRVRQQGDYDPSTRKGQSITATAEEILGRRPTKRNITETAEAIVVAPYLDDPIVAAAADPAEARKIIREQANTRRRVAGVRTFDPAATPHKLHLADTYEALPSFIATDKVRFNCIILDPPYGKNMHKKESFDNDRHEYDDSDEAFQRVCTELAPLTFEAAAAESHLFCFCDIGRFTELFAAFTVARWDVWPRPLIWDKGNTGSYGDMVYGFRACYDAVLYANKGRKKVAIAGRDVINISQATDHLHPAGKPVELYLDLLRRSCYPGDRVADFMCGSGPIFPAASQLSCVAYGWESVPKYHAMAVERLKALVHNPRRG